MIGGPLPCSLISSCQPQETYLAVLERNFVLHLSNSCWLGCVCMHANGHACACSRLDHLNMVTSTRFAMKVKISFKHLRACNDGQHKRFFLLFGQKNPKDSSSAVVSQLLRVATSGYRGSEQNRFSV